jgi:hypothetical protein
MPVICSRRAAAEVKHQQNQPGVMVQMVLAQRSRQDTEDHASRPTQLATEPLA